MDGAIDLAINGYAKEQGTSPHRYQAFIDKLNLTPDNIYLKRVITIIAADLLYAEATFSWFNDTHSFDDLKQYISELETILRQCDDNTIPVNFKVTKYPLGALLLFDRSELMGVYLDIFIVLRLYCITLCLTQEASNLKTAFNIATEVRVIFQSLKNRNASSNELYHNKKNFVSGLLKSQTRLKEIQLNFLGWIENDVFSSTTKNHPGINAVATSENQKTEQLASKSVIKPPRTHPVKLFIAEPSTIKSASIALRVSIANEKTTALDEDPDIEETIEVTASADHPLSHDGLQSVALTGSRLLVYERLHLNLRASVLDEVERKHFIEQILVALLHKRLPTRVAAIELLLMFLLSQNAESLEKLTISVAGDQVADINLSAKAWRRLSVKMPSAISAPTSPFLHPHTENCELPIPEALIAAIRSVMTTDKCTFVMIKAQAKTTKDDTLTLIRDIFAIFPRRYTQQQIRATLFDFIAKRHDPGYAALLLANTEYCVPTPLYYKSMSSESLANSYRDILVELGFDVASQDFSPMGYTGSELALDDTALAAMFSEIYQHLMKLRDAALGSEKGAIDYYNQLSCFGVLVCLACTGHRTRDEFQFEPTHIDFENGLLLLADKICFEEAAVRLLPLPQLMLKLFDVFAKTSRRLADKLGSPLLATHLRHKFFYRDGLDEPFFTLISDEGIRPVSAKQVKAFLESFGFDLPLNAFRHRLCSRLTTVDAHDYSQWFMGHISEGEHPMNVLSAMTWNDIVRARPFVEAALAPLQIQLPEHLETRGLKTIKTSVSGALYFPAYLTPESMTLRQRVKWCRQQYMVFQTDPGCNSDDVFEKIEGAIAELTNGLERAACQKILLRMHEKYLMQQQLPNLQYWRGMISERLVVLPTDLFAKQKYIMKIINALKTQLFQVVQNGTQIGLYHIVLSLVINNVRVYESRAFIKSLQRGLNALPDMVFFHYSDVTTSKLQICDPMTVALITRASPKWRTANFNETQFFKLVQQCLTERGVELDSEQPTFTEFCEQIATYYIDHNEPACIRAYRLGEFSTSPMSLPALVRLFTPDVIPVAIVFDKPATRVSTKVRSVAQGYNLKEEFQFFSTFLSRVKEKFSRLEKIETPFKQVIPEMWQEQVSAKTDDVNNLIDSSDGLSDIAVAVLIFMCDVGKRPGVGRANISFRTIETYFSKICRPLLDLVGEQPFFDYDSDEILEIYQSIFDNRDLKTEARHLDILRDFHGTVARWVYLPEIDWAELGISTKIDNFRVSELCSEQDYKLAIELLANDPFASDPERLIQTGILILAARFGLRRREIFYMLRVDLDFRNNLIAVLTNQYYRVKTPAGNRRIPIDLLINENEIAILNSLNSLSEKMDPADRARLFPVGDRELLTRVNRVLEALKLSTNNPAFRLYDCRHTFISQLVLAGLVRDAGKLYNLSATWLRQPPHDFRRRWLHRTAGANAFQNKFLHTIALAAGHTTPRTTLNRYSHVLEWIAYEYQMTNLYSKHELIEVLKLADLNNYSARKFLDRSKNTLALSAVQKLISKTDDLPQLVTVQRENSSLSDKTRTLSNEIFDGWLNIVHSLRKIMSGKTDENLDVVDFLLGSQSFTSFPFVSLNNKNIKIEEDKRLHKKIFKALHNRKIIDLLRMCSQQSDDFKKFILLLKAGFTGSRYIYEGVALNDVITTAERFGISAQVSGEAIAKTGRVVRRGRTVIFEKNQKNVDYELWGIVHVIDIYSNCFHCS
ncbi:hypothetical protein [Alishewanella sp. HL-SH05]|uniref:hypothetical protein n=1 Tax=Alishewanella sp. HL-SH05 TaxID=3461145 RepID=UPI004042F665